jgi:hypothetical protein
LDLNEPYLQANINAYNNGVQRDYLTSISIPEEDAPKPPLAQEENFFVNENSNENSAPSNTDYLSMSPKSGIVKYNNAVKNNHYLRPESPTIQKNLNTSPKNKKNVNKTPELPEEVPMLSSSFNTVGLPSYHDSSLDNAYTDMNDPYQQNKENSYDSLYKNVFAPSENYVNIPSDAEKQSTVTNPSYITFNR